MSIKEIEEIVDLDKVGRMSPTKKEFYNHNPMNASVSSQRALVIIDPQNDFIADMGTLKVKGAIDDTKRLIKYIYKNIDAYERISVTLDTHYKNSIFFPMAWDSSEDIIFKVITEEDINNKSVIPLMEMPEFQKQYVKEITKAGKQLTIWPYHCIVGTHGHAIEDQLSQMLEYYEAYRGKEIDRIIKGLGRYSEHYGALKPEVEVANKGSISGVLKLWLEDLKCLERIDICGQAKDYCLYETVKQMCEYYGDKNITSKIHVLYNLSSCIGDWIQCREKYKKLEDDYHIHICYAKEDGTTSKYGTQRDNF